MLYALLFAVIFGGLGYYTHKLINTSKTDELERLTRPMKQTRFNK